jgi:hypothetical protein
LGRKSCQNRHDMAYVCVEGHVKIVMTLTMLAQGHVKFVMTWTVAGYMSCHIRPDVAVAGTKFMSNLTGYVTFIMLSRTSFQTQRDDEVRGVRGGSHGKASLATGCRIMPQTRQEANMVVSAQIREGVGAR